MTDERFPEDHSNVRVVPSDKWPKLGELPSEMKSVNESVDELLVENNPSSRRPEEPPSEAQLLKAQILSNALKSAEEAHKHWSDFIEWSEITDPSFNKFRQILQEMEAAINTVSYREHIL